jgi:glycosyltransferase involved in cell wall biosynthesis
MATQSTIVARPERVVSVRRDEAAGPRIALFLPGLRGGGVERVFLHLAGAFVERDYRVDLVLTRLDGEYREAVPRLVNPVELAPVGICQSRLGTLKAADLSVPVLARPVLTPLKSSRILRHLPALARYLEHTRPDILVAAMPYPNLVAVWARKMADVPTRVIVTEHNTLSRTIQRLRRKWRWRYLPSMIASAYPGADRIVAVSDGVADDLALTASLPREAITTIYNPVVSSTLTQQARAPLDHPWFAPGAPPVVLGVGRLTRQKDFALLIRAFIRLRARREARLLILGEGRERHRLENIAANSEFKDDICLPGFVDNPYRYMARAGVFAVSSAHEGLSMVLIEALACGSPVVSTDCPSGPAEVLANGAYGRLVPVDDAPALAEAIETTLGAPPEPARLRERAAEFSVARAAERYLDLIAQENRG